MNFEFIKKITEVLLFSSDRPLSLKQIKDIINQENSQNGIFADIKSVENAVNELIEKYNSDDFSFNIIQIAGAYRFATKRDYAPWLAKLNKEKLKRKLSQSALETLSVIAYKQPVTKAEIEAIRGVNVDYIIGSLLEKELITIKGRAELPGRPMLYGTTDNLLEYLGLNSIDDLPSLKAIEEIIKAGPPEGITQSDIDFFEEINQAKEKLLDDENIASKLITEVISDIDSDNSDADSDNSTNDFIKQENDLNNNTKMQ
jgi:segregation and condensation protein B